MSRPHPHRTARAVPRLLLGALALLAAACGAAAEGEPDAAPAPAPAHGDGIRLPMYGGGGIQTPPWHDDAVPVPASTPS